MKFGMPRVTAHHSRIGGPMLRVSVVVVSGALLGSCAIQRAQTAAMAQGQMVGLSKEQVLSCMGAPASQFAEGSTEVWTYNSGDGRVTTFNTQTATANTDAESNGVVRFRGPNVYTREQTNINTVIDSFGAGISTRRACTVSVVMNTGHVSRVNYTGPTGGLLTQGEQCAYAVQNCAR